MKKVLIIGCCGTGKSTFARKLQTATGLPLIHLDRYFFKPGWVEPPAAEWQQTVRELIAGESWIIDGNFGGTMEMRMQAADTIIWIDLPRSICIYRVIKRVLFTVKGGRPDMAEGCDERIDWKFLKYVWNFRRNKNPLLHERVERVKDSAKTYILKSVSETEQFLEFFAGKDIDSIAAKRFDFKKAR